VELLIVSDAFNDFKVVDRTAQKFTELISTFAKVSARTISLLQLTVRLSLVAYYLSDFKNSSGHLLSSTSKASKYEPLLYVYLQDGGVFVIIRGSSETADDTDADVTEVAHEYGHFHHGFLTASEWVWPQIEPFLAAHDGPIYFTGDSYGASVGQILHVFAPSPAREGPLVRWLRASPRAFRSAAAPARASLYTFVNDDDIVPTLSIGNCCAYLHGIFRCCQSCQTVGSLSTCADLSQSVNSLDSSSLTSPK
jgi:hypothetical protein